MQLQQQIQLPGGPNLAVLSDILREKFLNGDVGLELVWFTDVRAALRKYIDTAKAVGDATKCKEDYGKILDGLANDLEASARQRTADAAFRINEAIARLSDAQQAPELLAALRTQLSHPNLFAQVKSDVVGAGIGGPIDEVAPSTIAFSARRFTARGGRWGKARSSCSPPTTLASWTSGLPEPTPARTPATMDQCACKPAA